MLKFAVLTLCVCVSTAYEYGYGDHSIDLPIDSYHDVQTIKSPSYGNDHKVQVVVKSNDMPVHMTWKSQASPVYVRQQHKKTQGSYQKTDSRDEPHRLVHEVIKPVIQELREVIQPYRKVVQVVEPVREERLTKVHKKEGHQGYGEDNGYGKMYGDDNGYMKSYGGQLGGYQGDSGYGKSYDQDFSQSYGQGYGNNDGYGQKVDGIDREYLSYGNNKYQNNDDNFKVMYKNNDDYKMYDRNIDNNDKYYNNDNNNYGMSVPMGLPMGIHGYSGDFNTNYGKYERSYPGNGYNGNNDFNSSYKRLRGALAGLS